MPIRLNEMIWVCMFLILFWGVFFWSLVVTRFVLQGYSCYCMQKLLLEVSRNNMECQRINSGWLQAREMPLPTVLSLQPWIKDFCMQVSWILLWMPHDSWKGLALFAEHFSLYLHLSQTKETQKWINKLKINFRLSGYMCDYQKMNRKIVCLNQAKGNFYEEQNWTCTKKLSGVYLKVE